MTITIYDCLKIANDPFVAYFNQDFKMSDFLNPRLVSKFFNEFMSQDGIWSNHVIRRFPLYQRINSNTYFQIYIDETNSLRARVNRDVQLALKTKDGTTGFLESLGTEEARTGFSTPAQKLNAAITLAFVAALGTFGYNCMYSCMYNVDNTSLILKNFVVLSFLFLPVCLTDQREDCNSCAIKITSFFLATLPAMVRVPVNGIYRVCESIHYYVDRR